ncbi:hypothetical protein BDN70DRAFT_998294 [Pholiota conissans]|uniref:F-box domain-containing protein n=1 Tax=Pholiota conissans TaxID=109636 RepID=A0A9P5YP58_9AGAR|nr:hypothetical protein BDN70DRAFT_998294 [Pholiota conissans]
MESQLSPSSLSPIDKLPYDALCEIFSHCVPTHPNVFDSRPKTTPFTLSHACSSWRFVAHTTPHLWCYLNHTVGVQYRDERWMVLKRDIDLVRSWRSKHGIILPFIVMHVRPLYPFEEEQLVDEDAFSFILEYLASAQYLFVDATIWDELATRKITCPNLRTVVLHSDGHISEAIFSNLQSVMGLTPTPPLQQLFMLSFTLSPENALLSPGPWSSLTHVVLWNIIISLRFWFNFVAVVPTLRWAYLRIYEIKKDYENFIEYTLPQLCSLFIERRNVQICDLFSNLYLPTLRTLSLSLRRVSSWTNMKDVIAKLPSVLKAAPNIIAVGLSENFLPIEDKWQESDDSEMGLPSIMGATPLWMHTPYLTHLVFEKFFRTDTEEIAERVDLYRSDCPIRKLTVVDGKRSTATGDSTESQKLELSEDGSELERSICVEFDTETPDQKAWDPTKTWELVD